jgi:hypothetical protein
MQLPPWSAMKFSAPMMRLPFPPPQSGSPRRQRKNNYHGQKETRKHKKNLLLAWILQNPKNRIV